MSKFNQTYKAIVEAMGVSEPKDINSVLKPIPGSNIRNSNSVLNPSKELTDWANQSMKKAPAAGRNTPFNIPPQQKASISKAILDAVGRVNPAAAGSAGNAIQAIKAAGTTALDAIGNMSVNDILGVAKTIAMKPTQTSAQLGAQAGQYIQKGQEVVNTLLQMAKERMKKDGISDPEADNIIKQQFEQEKEAQRIDQYISG